MDLITLLQSEFNKNQIIIDEENLVPYSIDESENKALFPQAALIAQSPLEVEKLLTLALEHRFPVTPRGLGTGKSGGSIPMEGGVVLALDRMNKILEIDEDSLFAVCEPGVITENLQNEVWEKGLFYPPDPASLDQCTLGGNVAENAGGPRAFRYGVTSHYLLGMEVCKIGGERFFVGHKSVKGVSGYNLPGILNGSEGTLGVFTKLIFKLIPRPGESGILLAYFSSIKQAGECITRLLKSRIFPTSIELLDKNVMDHIRGVEGFNPPEEAHGAIICELENLPDDETLLENAAEIFDKNGAIHIDVAMDSAACRRVWAARRVVSKKIKEKHKHKISEDIAVPRGAIPLILDSIQDISKKHGVNNACYGHAGDGNLHVNFYSDEENPFEKFDKCIRELFILTISLGGTLSGEHGIGISKKPFMSIEHDPFSINTMKAIKKAWDPYNLLNPGKII
jgi:glycolate dehydrogenase FAD-linked subunit